MWFFIYSTFNKITSFPWKLNRHSYGVEFGITCTALDQSKLSNFVECTISEVIQGELQRQTCLLRKGHACQHKETVFPGFPHIIWVLLVAYDLPILMSNIASKIEWISFLKFSIGNCSMAPRVNLKKAYDTIRLWLIAYAYVRHSRTYNENKLSISTPLFGLLPNFIPWGTRYKSVNYGIGNYWST